MSSEVAAAMIFTSSACLARAARAALLLSAVLAAASASAATCLSLPGGSIGAVTDGVSNTIAFGETFCGTFGDGNLRGAYGLPAVLDGTVGSYAVVRRGFDVIPGVGIVDGTSNTIFVGETIDLQRAGNGWTRSLDGTITDGTSNTIFPGDGNVGRSQQAYGYTPGLVPGSVNVQFGDGSVRIVDGASNTFFLGDGSVRTLDGRRGIGVITDGTSNTILFEETPIDLAASDEEGVTIWLPRGHYRLRAVPGGPFGGVWDNGLGLGWSNRFGLRSGSDVEEQALFGTLLPFLEQVSAITAAPLVDLWVEADGPLTFWYPADDTGFADNVGGVRVIIDVVDASAPATLALFAAALVGLAGLRRRC
jgi:hypothetical protein